MNQEALRKTFASMIDYFRAEVEKLDEEKRHVQPISSLGKPCQLNIISSFNHSSHLVIKTHFHELEDKLIRITQLEQHSFATQLRNIITDPKLRLQTMETESHRGSYPCPDSLAHRIIRFGQIIGRHEINQAVRYHGLGVQLVIDPAVVVWELGSLEGWDYKKAVSNSISKLKTDAAGRRGIAAHGGASSKQPQTHTAGQVKASTTQTPERPTGFGTCFYPPILVGDIASMIEDQIHQRTEPLAKNALVAKIGDMKIAISKGGLLGVQTDDAETAEKALNTIMAVSLICGLPTSLVHKSEVARIRFEDGFEMRASEWMMSSLRMQTFDSLALSFTSSRERRIQISLEDLELIVGHCKRVWSAPKNHRLLELLLSAHTFLSSDIYWQSFLSSWTIIELHMHGLWKNKLKKSNVAEKITYSLNRLNTNSILKVLHVDELVTKSDYQNWNKMRILRNGVIHGKHTITEKQASECYEMARTILKEKMKIADTVSRKAAYYL